ncbi:hypothetical protein [uncultured Ruegeria sp.]|uniref:hypothetical protein n=1 Tax=uncultured Ruegeria sp. TaxID=259304 RepID=UPI0026231726|nr:hypothetical protein [uncultured Ruegeria sp.]
MPQEITMRILHAIRDIEGPNVEGVGPSLLALLQHTLLDEQDPYDVLTGINEAERFGFVKAQRIIPQGPMPGYPKQPVELRAIIAVYILEAGQAYLDG